MFGLTRDFHQNGGTYMVLGGGNTIHTRDISLVQAGMITASRIPNFLPLRIKELDLHVTLQYDISDKKMLSHMLKGEKISMNEYYRLLLQTAIVLEDSKQYMLNAERYILHEDYVFVEGPLQSGKLYFTYVPIESVEHELTLANLLKDLITRMMASVIELRGVGVQRLLQFVSGDQFSVTGFKNLLLGLLTLHEGSEEISNISHSNIPDMNSIDKNIQSNHKRELRATSKQNDPRNQMGNISSNLHESYQRKQPQVVHGERNLQSKVSVTSEREVSSLWGQERYNNSNSPISQINDTDEDDDEEPGPSKGKVYVLLGSLLAAAMIWRLIYLSSPSATRLIICMVLTAVLAGSAWIGWSGRVALPNLRRGIISGKERMLNKDSKTDEDQISESDWKWTFPQKDEGEYSEQTLLESSQQFSRQSRSVLRQNNGTEGDHVSSMWNQMDLDPSPSHSQNDNPDIHPYFMNQDTDQDYYSHLGQKTEMLNSSSGNATVLLQPQEKSIQGDYKQGVNRIPPYLERTEEGQPPATRIELHLPHFIIGRSDDVAQFVEISAGTSRAHVELSKGSDGNYVIKDLGSKNGTLLLGEPMIPYKEYTLNDSDTFTIVKGKYTYHKS